MGVDFLGKRRYNFVKKGEKTMLGKTKKEFMEKFVALEEEITQLRTDLTQTKKTFEEAPAERFDFMRNLYISKATKFEELTAQLVELSIKQQEYIKVAATNAVKEALKGEIRAIVKETVKEAASSEGESSLFENGKSVLGVSKEITRDIIEQLGDRVTEKIIDTKTATKQSEEERKEELLALPKHACYPKLAATIKAGLMPMLVGPAGTGKSTAVEQAAFDLGFKFYSSNRVQMAFELTGFKDASGVYQPTQFYNAYNRYDAGIYELSNRKGLYAQKF